MKGPPKIITSSDEEIYRPNNLTEYICHPFCCGSELAEWTNVITR